MNLKEKLDSSTDKAWESLYQRLEKDRLLGLEINPGQPKLRRNTVIYTWAASVAVLVIGLVSYFLIQKNNSSVIETLIVHNEQGMPTLVTTLDDGSTIYLSEETSIEYPSHFAAEKREVSLTGDAFFEIARNEEAPFIIDTHNALVEVLGTSFSVQSKDETFELSVRNGEVRVTSKATGKSVHVRGGETVLLHSDKLQTVATQDLSRFKSYLNHIHFKDQTIANVIRIMNEKNSDDTQIVFSPEIANRKFTVTFSNESPSEIAEIICIGLHLQHTRRQDKIYINPSD